MPANEDPNQTERIEMRKAYNELLSAKTAISKLITIPMLTESEVEKNIDALKSSSIELRGVPTTSRRSKLLQKISDELLALVNDYPNNPQSWYISANKRNELITLIDLGLKTIDNRLDELKREIVAPTSPLIDMRMGNHKFTLYGLITVIYIGGLAFIAALLGIYIISSILLLIFAITCILSFVDLFMVVWTRPYWLYLPSEKSLANRVLNSSLLWMLLPLFTTAICLALFFLGLEIILLLSQSYSVDFISIFLGIISIVSSTILIKYAQWRKNEYLVCPNPHCSDIKIPTPNALLVHYQNEHGIELDEAVASLRLQLAKAKKPPVRKFRHYWGYFLLTISWFVNYEVLFLFREANYFRFGILIISDIIIIWWALYELHLKLERTPVGIPRKIISESYKTAGNAVFIFIFLSILLKGLLAPILSVLLSVILEPIIVLVISVSTFMNSGVTQAIAVPYLRRKYRTVITDNERWNKLFSNRRCFVWLVAIYAVYIAVATLAIMGGYEIIEILRFSYISSDLIIFAWAADVFYEIRLEVLSKVS